MCELLSCRRLERSPLGLALSKRPRKTCPAEAKVATQQLAYALMRHNVPVTRVMDIVETNVPESVLGRRACDKMMQSYSKLTTIYGQLTKTMEIPLVGGGATTVYMNNPFSFIRAAAELSQPFNKFLQRHLPKKASISIYNDETTPGNQHRPDNARSYTALKWTLLDLPTWFRERKHGWFRFGYILTDDLVKMLGGPAALAVAMLLEFFPASSGFSFEHTGMKLPEAEAGRQEYHFNAEFTFFIVDEKAGKEDLDLKGAGGAKPCSWCKNILGAKSQPGDSTYLCRYTEHRRALWDPHTPASYREMVAMLSDCAANRPGELEELQIMLGLKLNQYGIHLHPHLARIVQMPYAFFYDTMHCLFSSGGVCQYQVNAFVCELEGHGIAVASLDNFHRLAKGHKLQPGFFAARVVPKSDAHIRAFASEVVDAINVLRLFCMAVVEPAGVMQDHVRCLYLIHAIVKVFGKPDDVSLNADRCEAYMEEYAELYVSLYKSIPKIHLMRHSLDAAKHWGKMASCWAPERDHSFTHGIARHSYNKVTKTILDRANFHFFSDLLNDDTMFQEIHLVKPAHCDLFKDVLEPLTSVRASTQIMSHIGHVANGSYVHLLDVQQLQLITFAQAKAFLEVKSPTATEPSFFVVCAMHDRVGSQTWAANGSVEVVPVARIVCKDVAFLNPETPGVVMSSM